MSDSDWIKEIQGKVGYKEPKNATKVLEWSTDSSGKVTSNYCHPELMKSLKKRGLLRRILDFVVLKIYLWGWSLGILDKKVKIHHTNSDKT